MFQKDLDLENFRRKISRKFYREVLDISGKFTEISDSSRRFQKVLKCSIKFKKVPEKVLENTIQIMTRFIWILSVIRLYSELGKSLRNPLKLIWEKKLTTQTSFEKYWINKSLDPLYRKQIAANSCSTLHLKFHTTLRENQKRMFNQLNRSTSSNQFAFVMLVKEWHVCLLLLQFM
jgi:hypothetical protein